MHMLAQVHYTEGKLTLLAECPAYRIMDTILWTRDSFSFLWWSRIAAAVHRTALDLGWSCTAFFLSTASIIEKSVGALVLSSAYRLSQSNLAIDSRSMLILLRLQTFSVEQSPLASSSMVFFTMSTMRLLKRGFCHVEVAKDRPCRLAKLRPMRCLEGVSWYNLALFG